MTLINKPLLSLTGGVSQQAAPLRLASQCDQQTNYSASLVNSLQTRPPLSFKTHVTPTDGAFYAIDRDNKNIYNLIINSQGLNITDGQGNPQTVTIAQDALDYLKTPLFTNPYTAYKVLTLADCTYILNTNIQTRLTQDTRTPWKNHALIFIKQVNYATTWSLQINETTTSFGYGGQESDGSCTRYKDGVSTGTKGAISSVEVAGELAKIPVTNFTITQKGSVLWICRTDNEPFKIGAADTRGDTCMTLITSKVQEFSTLPTTAPDGYTCRILGKNANTADDYYVTFETNAGTDYGKGVWKECDIPGSQYTIDPKTMPWKLIHKNNGTWELTTETWKERTTGDEESSPTPSYINKKLKNIFLFRNRLCFLTDDILCMSTAADYTNWWNETALALSDSDPIYLSASTDRVADLYDFGTLSDSLIIFGENNQFQLETGDILSPKTAALTPCTSTSYTNATGVASAGSRLYFGSKTGDSFTVSEFGISSVTGNKEANSITSHIPSYIPHLKRTRLSASDNVSTIAITSDKTPDTIAIYQYYISSAQKLQSAWHKYTFTDTDIKGHLFRDNILWLYMLKQGTTPYIATIDLAEHPQINEPKPHLDYCQALTSDTPTTQYQLPDYINPNRLQILIYTPEGHLTATNAYIITNGTINIFTPATTIIVGEKYTRTYTFSTQYISSKKTTGEEKIITTGRWQLQKLKLTHGYSGTYKVTITRTDDNTTTSYTYTGIRLSGTNSLLGRLPVSDGEFEIPLRALNTDITVTVSSDSWLPENLTSATWQGNYITKVKTI